MNGADCSYHGHVGEMRCLHRTDEWFTNNKRRDK